ncbi:hypothetical protein GCM10023091_27880 [Ravibacter arvi]|uniref:TANFOR domain-containing protein n=1 Tax=Ravibacter arvi TaxID=2051041 RepID=A0ABP8M3R1_9BACT
MKHGQTWAMEFPFNKNRTGTIKLLASLMLMICTGVALQAQDLVRITVNVFPPYSPYIQDYPGLGNQVQVFVSNQSGKAQAVRLLGRLEGDNGVVIQTLPNYRPLRPLQLEATDLNRMLSRMELENLFDLQQIDVQGMDKRLLYNGLPLPEGNYQLCIQAFDYASIRPLSSSFPGGCSTLIPVRTIEPPVLISPYDTEVVRFQNPPAQVFSWSAPAGVLPNKVEYSVRIIELPNADTDPNVFIDAVALPKSGVEIEHLRTTSFLYGPQFPPLQFGKKYAWRVQAHSLDNRLHLMNDGKSPVSQFQYGLTLQPGSEWLQPLAATENSGSQTLSADLPVNCSCKAPPAASKKVDNSTALKNKKATIAGFPLEFLNGVKEEKGKLSGMGMIPVPMINSGYVKLRVKLIDLQCNSSGEVIGGAAKVLYKDKVAGYLPNLSSPEAPNVQLSAAQIQNMGEYFKNTKEQLISNLVNSANSIGFELPLGLDRQIGPVHTVIAITDMTFTPQQAFFNANTWIENQSDFANGIPLSGYNMCLSPSKPCGDGMLYLAEDMKLSPYFSLKGGASGGFFQPDTNVVTYVHFDQNGFNKMRVHGLLSPPMLVRADAPGQPLEVGINANVTDFKDWTAKFSIPAFHVKGLEDFTFSLADGDQGIYDHSETVTPGPLPEGYLESIQQNTWQGLFFPKIQMELPAFLAKGNGQRIKAGLENMIYDSEGFTGTAFVKDLLTLGNGPENDGSMGGWYYAIDTFNARFDRNSFKTASLDGRIVLPIFTDPYNKSSQLPYTSTLSKNADSGGLEFELTVAPTDKMGVDIWKAVLNLDPSSSIKAVYDGKSFSATARLSGSMDFAVGPLAIPAATFTNLTLSTAAPYFSLDQFNMSTASPPKELNGKPYNLDYAGKARNGTTGFEFEGSIDLTDGAGITGNGGLILAFSTGKSTNGRPDWKYQGLQSANFKAGGTVGPLKVGGALAIYENDPERGSGFKGDLEMQMLQKFSVTVAAQFGRTSGAGGFNYWFVGGRVKVPEMGIPMAGPLFFKGFGGGLYANMTPSYGSEQVVYTPQKGTKGFEAAVLAGIAAPNVLDAEGRFSITFDEGWVPEKMYIGADAWFLGENSKSALATGKLDLLFDLQSEKISANATLTAGLDAGLLKVTGTLPAQIEIEYGNAAKAGQPSVRWYLAIGKPIPQELRAKLNVSVSKTLGLTFGSYFVIANYKPDESWTLPPPPYGFDQPPFADLYQSIRGKRSQFNDAALQADTKAMLAFGAGFALNNEYKIPPFFMQFGGAVGFDLLLKKMDTPCYAGGSLPGINGWYAEGQLYAGLSFSLGIDVDLWIYEGRITVAELSAGAILRGGLVNPVWLNGQVAVRYRVLRGLVKGNFNFDFWYNREQQCNPAFLPPNPFADMPLISSLGPSGTETKTPVLSPFTATFNYPVENKLIVDIEIPDGKNVDANAVGTVRQQSETDADGTVTTRRIFTQEFKLQFKEKFVAKVIEKGKKAGDLTDNNAGELVMGNNNEGDRNYAASYFREHSLLPQTTYELAVGIQVYVYRDGQLEPFHFKNQTVEQTEKVTFTTGGCPVELSKGVSSQDLVLTSYPYEGQRFFMKGETQKAFVKLKAKPLGCSDELGSDENYDLKIAVVPLEGDRFAQKPVALIDAEFVGNQYVYDLPAALRNETLYRLQLLRVPKDDYLNSILAKGFEGQVQTRSITTANIYKQTGTGTSLASANNTKVISVNPALSNNSLTGYRAQIDNRYEKVANVYQDAAKLDQLAAQYGLQSSADETTVRAGMDIRQVSNTNQSMVHDLVARREKLKKSLRSELYRYYFKTSKYNTLQQKIGNASFTTAGGASSAAPGLKTGDVVSGSMTLDEGFDTYDLSFENLGYNQVRPPLVLLKATENSQWFKEVAMPIAKLVGMSDNSYFGEAGNGQLQDNTQLNSKALERIKRSTVRFGTFFFATEKPYENSEIFRFFPSEVHQ